MKLIDDLTKDELLSLLQFNFINWYENKNKLRCSICGKIKNPEREKEYLYTCQSCIDEML
jgi:hypothetical protein